MTEISFTKSWYNLQQEQEIFLYNEYKTISDESVTVPAGYYPSIETLLTMINGKIQNFSDKLDVLPHFSFISHSRKVILIFGRDKDNFKVNVRIGKELQEILGYRNNELKNKYELVNESFTPIEEQKVHPLSLINRGDEFSVEAPTPADLRAGINSLLVYADLLEPSIVSNVFAQLLRTVHIPNDAKFGDQCLVTIKNPTYIKLISNEFDTIRIDIKDDSGSDIRFQFGRVIISLEFRPWNNIM